MDAFYDQLKADLESTPHHEMKTVMGDLNEDDEKGRQAGLHERPGNSSRRGHQQGRTRQVYKITKLVSRAATLTHQLWINRESYSPRKQSRKQDGHSISANF